LQSQLPSDFLHFSAHSFPQLQSIADARGAPESPKPKAMADTASKFLIMILAISFFDRLRIEYEKCDRVTFSFFNRIPGEGEDYQVKSTDEECMIAYQAGDIKGFNELYGRYSGRVYAYLLQRVKSADQASDLLQAVFLKLHLTRARYLARYPFVAWLFTLSRTVFLDHLRSCAARGVQIPFQPGVHDPVLEPPTQSEALDLSALNAEQREIVRLRFEEDLAFDEIARRLELSPANARQRLSRAIKRLRLFFTESES
jgi:RNA polymerase sigma-70 factor (ECF subfamily)